MNNIPLKLIHNNKKDIGGIYILDLPVWPPLFLKVRFLEYTAIELVSRQFQRFKRFQDMSFSTGFSILENWLDTVDDHSHLLGRCRHKLTNRTCGKNVHYRATAKTYLTYFSIFRSGRMNCMHLLLYKSSSLTIKRATIRIFDAFFKSFPEFLVHLAVHRRLSLPSLTITKSSEKDFGRIFFRFRNKIWFLLLVPITFFDTIFYRK